MREECEVFSRDKFDIGDIEDFQMEIKVTDDTPINQSYRRLPKNLYEEVKNYIDDLLLHKCIQSSNSSCASQWFAYEKRMIL